jgi:hypothetical protein
MMQTRLAGTIAMSRRMKIDASQSRRVTSPSNASKASSSAHPDAARATRGLDKYLVAMRVDMG